MGRPIFILAAAAVVIAATAAAVVGAHYAVVATAAEQNEQDDDPAPVTATETIVIHKNTSKNFLRQSRSFQDIPQHKICAAILKLYFHRRVKCHTVGSNLTVIS